jgi:hypothetical protein
MIESLEQSRRSTPQCSSSLASRHTLPSCSIETTVSRAISQKDAHAKLEKMIHNELLRAQERGEIDMKSNQISALATARLIDHAVQGIAQHALTSGAAWPNELFQLIELLLRGLRDS